MELFNGHQWLCGLLLWRTGGYYLSPTARAQDCSTHKSAAYEQWKSYACSVLELHSTQFLICNHLSECLSYWKNGLSWELWRLHFKRFVDHKHESMSMERPRPESQYLWPIKTAGSVSNKQLHLLLSCSQSKVVQKTLIQTLLCYLIFECLILWS